MANKGKWSATGLAAVLLLTGPLAAYGQSAPSPEDLLRMMSAELKKAGKKPAEIFTILNPEPGILDAYVKSGKTVRITVRIVSGDNVNIEKIDGKAYGKATDAEEKKKDTKK